MAPLTSRVNVIDRKCRAAGLQFLQKGHIRPSRSNHSSKAGSRAQSMGVASAPQLESA
jgi:hypothetical protein